MLNSNVATWAKAALLATNSILAQFAAQEMIPCSAATQVDYTARLDCGTSSTARAAAAAAAAADAQCATAGTEAELGCPAPAFPTGAFPAGSTIQTCQCYCPPVRAACMLFCSSSAIQSSLLSTLACLRMSPRCTDPCQLLNAPPYASWSGS